MKVFLRWSKFQPDWFSLARLDFYVGENEGWSDLFEKAMLEILYAIEFEPQSYFHIRQVKEKFGTLRIVCEIDPFASFVFKQKVSYVYQTTLAASSYVCRFCGKDFGFDMSAQQNSVFKNLA